MLATAILAPREERVQRPHGEPLQSWLGERRHRESVHGLDVLDEHGRCRDIEAARPYELANERLDFCRWLRECLVQLREVFVVTRRARQQSATRFEQIPEVHRAHLALVPLWQQDCVHRASEDSGFDKRARVQPGHDRAVIQRVEVVGARRRVERVAAPQHDLGEWRQIDALPLGTTGWMRPDQDRSMSQSRRVAPADAPDPVHDERRFRRAAAERR